MNRRDLLAALGASLAAPLASAAFAAPAAPRYLGEAALAKLERKVKGRLGVYVLDTRNARGFGHRSAERFAMCSTFKLSLGALAMREIDAGRLDAKAVLPYTQADIQPGSPVTEAHLAEGGMTVWDLIKAAQTKSDNTAANVLLKKLGGPEALTAFWRSLGDTTSRLDRYEPELNVVKPGEELDTTTPEAIARSVARFVAGDVLKPETREWLVSWTGETDTGLKRIRAGIEPDWYRGDKTGTAFGPGLPTRINDIGVVFLPHSQPLVIAAFYEPRGAPQAVRPEDEAVLAQVGRICTLRDSWRTAA